MSSNLAYQEELWEELIDGKVVAMSPAAPRHNRISGNIHGIFWSYLKGKKCVPFNDSTIVHLTEKDHFVPDFMVVCDRDKIKSQWVAGAPNLVVEVLSPGTAKNDKWHKKNVYESSGVPEYWIVSSREKSIEVYLLQDGRYVLDNIYTYYSQEELAELEEKDRAKVVSEFKCHLYDDLIIRLEDIFGDLF